MTGASEGIGKATALAFAREGATVVLASRNADKGNVVLDELTSEGGKGIYVETDVTKSKDVENLINVIVQEFGRLDCVFNNAGGGSIGGSVTECTEEDWDYCVDLNLKSVWLCMKYEILQMIQQGHGSIVNNSSVDGLRAFPTNVPYSASKKGIIALSNSAALGYIDNGIRVNTICPAWIGTERIKKYIKTQKYDDKWIKDQQPIGRLGTPQEVAGTVLWLCSDASSFITGQVVGVDGGYLL